MQRKGLTRAFSWFGCAMIVTVVAIIAIGGYFVTNISAILAEDDEETMVWNGSGYAPASSLGNLPTPTVRFRTTPQSAKGGSYGHYARNNSANILSTQFGSVNTGGLHCSSSATVHSIVGSGSNVSGNNISNGSNAGNSSAGSGQLYASTSVYISSPKISASFRSMSAPVEATYTEVGEEIARRNIRMGRPVDPIDEGDDDTPAVESPVGDGTITLIVLALLFALLTYKRQISLKNNKKQ